jgi:hypothetical protein
MDDYRANAEDVAQDKADADAKIVCPTPALWGEDFYAVGKLFEIMAKARWSELDQPSFIGAFGLGCVGIFASRGVVSRRDAACPMPVLMV